MISKISEWWKDNLKRPSTWSGVSCFILAYFVFTNKDLLHQFLGNVINDTHFIELVVGAISGGLIAHKQRDD